MIGILFVTRSSFNFVLWLTFFILSSALGHLKSSVSPRRLCGKSPTSFPPGLIRRCLRDCCGRCCRDQLCHRNRDCSLGSLDKFLQGSCWQPGGHKALCRHPFPQTCARRWEQRRLEARPSVSRCCVPSTGCEQKVPVTIWRPSSWEFQRREDTAH